MTLAEKPWGALTPAEKILLRREARARARERQLELRPLRPAPRVVAASPRPTGVRLSARCESAEHHICARFLTCECFCHSRPHPGAKS